MLELAAYDIRLIIAPEFGGSVAAFSWRDMPVFRRSANPIDAFDMACFPLVPFAGRIANGRFVFDGRTVALRPNRADIDLYNPLHGYGWLEPWEVIAATASTVKLAYEYSPQPPFEDGPARQWPWAFGAEQKFELVDGGYLHRLSLTNRADTDMPCGLGLHPYFPRDGASVEVGLNGVWHNDASGIPERFEAGSFELLGERPWDNTFTGRKGAIRVAGSGHALTIEPDPALAYTHVYCPENEDFFCIEPVSHLPDCFNRADHDFDAGQRVLGPGECFHTATRFTVSQAAV
ncbi:hypothetical protein CD351_08315 [Erythrobacter sp. KY5]|uniref:aldose 1-epimerase n=1 Tax=Erythrobacter sp. KY5 TaxID=2011159 RepID=UPI000DBF0346|nr:aldose 1-epimerase [Erythrobacter sp. KY5]AWW74428.1 hypothetical protein CD351_08315 [Erythrobacter sp. KY5]